MKKVDTLELSFLNLAFTGKVGMLLCTRGEHELMINGRYFCQTRGMICIMSPLFVIQSIRCSDDFEYCILKEDMNTIFPIIKASANMILNLDVLENPVFILEEDTFTFMRGRMQQIDEIRKTLDSIVDKSEIFLSQQSLRLFVQQTIAEFLLRYYRQSPVVQKKNVKYMNIFIGFVLSLHKNFRQHRSVQYYADEAHLSTGHFSALVRNNIGTPPSELIAIITISNIKLLLTQTSKSIKEIAEELNFPEQFTFRKYFKQHVGISPKEYRASMASLRK